MSEEPRLSRRQLREMGELAPRDASVPSLTETEELRLRRPSRRELREAERANAEAEERIRSTFESVSANDISEVPVASLSGNSEEPAAFGEFFGDFAAEEEAESSAHDQRSETIPSPDMQPSLERKSLFERFGDDEEEKPEASLHDRLVERTSEDFSSAAEDDTASAEAGGEEVHELPAAEGDAVVEDNAQEPTAKDEECVCEISPEKSSDMCAEQEPDGDACDSADSKSDDESIESGAGAEAELDRHDSELVTAEPQEETRDPESETVATEKSEDQSEAVVVVDTKRDSGGFGWLVLLILIVIGAMIGYLGGMWFATVWLAAPSMGIESIVTTVLTI